MTRPSQQGSMSSPLTWVLIATILLSLVGICLTGCVPSG